MPFLWQHDNTPQEGCTFENPSPAQPGHLDEPTV